MPLQPDKSTERAWALLTRVQQSMRAAIEHDLRNAGLPPLTWYDVLLELERADGGGLRPFELERHLLLAQYNLSRLLDRMQKAGYLKRHAHAEDGRGRIVEITGSGKTIRKKIWPIYRAALKRTLGERLTQAEVKRLETLLGVLAGKG